MSNFGEIFKDGRYLGNERMTQEGETLWVGSRRVTYHDSTPHVGPNPFTPWMGHDYLGDERISHRGLTPYVGDKPVWIPGSEG